MLFNNTKIILTFLMTARLALSIVPDSEVLIPARNDWSIPKEITGLNLGPQKSWDDFHPGAITPCTIVNLSGTYYLYYIGSDGKRDHDNGPAHRKLGLATSSNGIDFTKYDGNPILSWSPMDNDEEGIFGAKALLINGKIYLYINTISARNATTDQVWADVHLVISADGKKFSNPILVLDHNNADVTGYGDELGPTGIMHKDGKWSLYYFAKGRGVSSWGLCLATGDSPTLFGNTQTLIDEKAFFGTGGDVHWLSNSKIAMFFQKRSDWDRIEVYTAPADNPDKLTKVRTWDGFIHKEGMTVFLDKHAGKWFMYNSKDGKMFVRIAPVKYNKQWRVTNEIISITASARDAGAVCSLVYDGKEFVNDDDHGRQMQVAWIYNDMDEAYNPTEAGSGRDGTGSKTTSQLLSVQIQSNILRTVNHPAYWRHTDMPEKHRSNTALVTRDTLAKKLTIGHDGDPHVLVFDTVVTISPELTGPPVTSLRIEAPTLYATADLSRHYLFDLTSGALTEVPSRSNRKNVLNTRISRITRRDLIPILSSPDGRYSVAFYTPQAENFWAYFTWDVPCICVKVTTFFKHAVKTGRSYSYRNFVIVGDMATVKTSALQLHKRESKELSKLNKLAKTKK